MSRARKLTKSDIRAFDQAATDLVLEMVDADWTGYISSKGHAIMFAPDGRATLSIARDSKRGRSGRNAAAAYRRWEQGGLAR